ncbi:MAG TPA: PQQ-dependent sugar dehydrogenase, partial [Actinophytocola sp.]|uniref:PQQ-dependent sugar dehydrogenase n=1 Tax=Actinophytocola sp. TaxID=1872138 RepID=UPI002E066014|nr:PQQ-dependent sugar dehydrogenase [Actinophytocola sp.]
RRYLLAVLAAGAMVAFTAPPASAESVPVTDPIPEQPIVSNLALTLQEFAQFPQSAPTPAPTDPRLMRWARINYIGELPDRSGRLYVPDLNGKLYLVDRAGTPHEYLDVAATFAPDFVSGRGLGTGFGFVAFHPEFARNGKFYTVHSEWDAALTTKTPDLTAQPNTRFHAVIDEWTATDPRAATFSGTRREVLRLGFAGQIHAIQQIDFNPTARPHDPDYGLLYIAAGDGGQGAGNGNNDPQNLAIPQGKILRIDPLGTNSANGRYGIPANNPFVGTAGAIGEIYAYGMRDPHRFSWDPRAGNRLFLGHIGEHAIEAVYDVRAGDNLGWPDREGNFVFNKADRCHLYTLPDDDAQFGYNYPVAAFDHDPPPGLPCTADSGHAMSGGFVYRGFRVLPLYGKYLFADLVTGEIFYSNANEMRRGRERAPVHELRVVDAGGNLVTMADLAGSARVDLRFGRDGSGELYLLSKANGKIWKITGVRCVNP